GTCGAVHDRAVAASLGQRAQLPGDVALHDRVVVLEEARHAACQEMTCGCANTRLGLVGIERARGGVESEYLEGFQVAALGQVRDGGPHDEAQARELPRDRLQAREVVRDDPPQRALPLPWGSGGKVNRLVDNPLVGPWRAQGLQFRRGHAETVGRYSFVSR